MGNFTLFSLVMLLSSITYVLSLECYVCDNQDNNNEKCVKTINNCEYGQDVCMNEIKWGTMPYWSQGAKKQYYISKRCSTKAECAMIKQRNMAVCTHIWYQDWVCSDCCLGDRCNYYVISESSISKPYLQTLLGIFFLQVLL